MTVPLLVYVASATPRHPDGWVRVFNRTTGTEYPHDEVRGVDLEYLPADSGPRLVATVLFYSGATFESDDVVMGFGQ